MKTLGSVYAEIGKVVYDDGQPVRIELDVPGLTNDVEEVLRAIASINSDLKVKLSLRSRTGESRVVAIPPSDDDLDALADAVAIRSRGKMCMTHSCPNLGN